MYWFSWMEECTKYRHPKPRALVEDVVDAFQVTSPDRDTDHGATSFALRHAPLAST